MQQGSPLTQLLQSCRNAIRKGNLEKCFELLDENLAKGEATEAVRNQLILSEGRLNFALRERNAGRDDTYNTVYQQVSDEMLKLLSNLKEEHITLLNRVNDEILILTYEGQTAEWKRFFPKDKFSHAEVALYGKEIPSDYLSPNVVIFDDTGPNARPYMARLAEEMPQAHFLYFGENNPFTESRKRNPQDAAIFDRCANANSKFTLHARLRELLEFRKIYGTP